MSEARTYGSLVRVGDEWMLDDVPPHVIQRLKAVFPSIPRANAPPYSFPADLRHAVELDWFMDRYPFEVSGADHHAIAAGRRVYESKHLEAERILDMEYVDASYAGIREGQTVRWYQAQAVDLLSRMMGLLLVDAVGLGKTFTAAAAMLLHGALPGVVVCQPHLSNATGSNENLKPGQWAKVLRAFTTLKVHEIRSTKPYALPAADVYVFRYTQIAGWADVFSTMGIGLVAYDEIQELRTGVGQPSTPVAKGVAARRLSACSRMRLGTTATPIYNYGTEIWDVMQFIRPEVLGPREDFMREWAFGGHVRDGKALNAYMRDQHAFLRRTKTDVGQNWPPVNIIVDTVGYDHATIKNATDLAHQLAIKATTGTFMERGHAARELDLQMRKLTGIAKARQVADYVRILVEGGEKVVLSGWHREVYAIWLKQLEDLNPLMYTGSETSKQKDANKEAFVAGESDLLIGSLRSGAGLDGLQQACSWIVFGELDWSPKVHHQWIGRFDREGQVSYPVNAVYLTIDEGSDPILMDIQGLKASEQHAIIDPDIDLEIPESDSSHVQRLVQAFLAKGKA